MHSSPFPGSSNRHSIDAARIAAAKQRVKLSELIGRALQLRRRGHEHLCLCPFHVEHTPSFTINDRKGFFHCFGCGAHGDHIDWLKLQEGLAFKDAIELLDGGDRAAARGIARSKEQATETKERSIAWARSLWRRALPAICSPVETYLQQRGIDLPVPEVLRFHMSLYETQTRRWHPAMLASIVNGEGVLLGVHRTYLHPSGRAKASLAAPKKVAGMLAGGVIRLAPATPLLGLAEGIETALSVMQATGIPCWAAVSLSNLAGPGIVPKNPIPHPTRAGTHLPSVEPDLSRAGIDLPAMVRAVELYVDADNRDQAVADCLIHRGARRLELLGVAVRIVRPPAGLDFNDVLVGGDGRSRGMR